MLQMADPRGEQGYIECLILSFQHPAQQYLVACRGIRG
jgi:hypothetical protein